MSSQSNEANNQHDECCGGHHHHHQKNKQQAASLNINAKPFTFSETSGSSAEQAPKKKHSRKPFNKIPNNNNNNNNGMVQSSESSTTTSSSGNVNENNQTHSQEKPLKKKPFAKNKPNHQQVIDESNQQPPQGQESNSTPSSSSSSTKPKRNNKQAFKKSSHESATTSSVVDSSNNNSSASNAFSSNTTSVNNRPPRSARKPKPSATTTPINDQQQEEGNTVSSPIQQQVTSSTDGSAVSKRRQKFQNHPHAKTFVKPIVADDNSDTISTTASDVSNSTATSASSSNNNKKKKKNNKPKVEKQDSEQKKDSKKKNKKKHHDNDEDMFWSHSFSNAGAFSTKTTRTVYDKLKAAKLTEEEVEALPLQDKIMYQLTKQTYDCMVCSDNILRQHHTWSCTDCYRVFHLQCIKRWVSEKVETEDRNHWKCPGCNSAKIVNIPTDYLCFCGKIANPKVNLEVIPHSCGGLCGKVRSCPHPCTDFCHPGPCKECDLTRDVKCHCGKETFYSIKCNDPNYKNGASCGRVCGKLLSCRKHTCPNPCHQGPCEPCKEIINVECYCGHSNLQQGVSCHTYSHLNTSIAHREYNLFDIKKGEDDSTIYRTYSCNQTCKKLLPCGQHCCDRVCHYGKCIGHKISQWVKTTSQEEEEGIDEYIKKNGCYQQCRSILKCGHFCTLKCHPNQIKCMKCNAQVEVYCKCGRKFEKRTCDGKSREESDVIFLDCDEECRKIQRVKQLAEAFQIDYDKFELPEYTNELTDFARRNLHIIKNWEFEFDVLLTSDNKRASKQFTPMKRERRALLHELAEHYKFSSVSVDAEPNRSVIVTLGTQSKRPSILLSEVVTDPEKLRKLKEKIIEQEEKERKEEIKRYRKFKSNNQSNSPIDEDEWTSVKGKSSYQQEEKEDVLSRIVHAGNNAKNIKAQDVDKKLFTNSFGSFIEQDHHRDSNEQHEQEPVKVGDTLNWANEMEDEDSKVLEESL
ncbi:predicted protein [Naegleria gruberi]|uniref:Predicted protein n=1 Tax=Naegleria gruberi TaxID=5762 RepID=D2VRK5_NAEGR|nr:uncharacterized protein NAEGRDRAFT_51700 [Naegleria gruberi]EFC40408.1 predicted protein [Naegleria gruberi]|eukprot:XP_002673152.1 predicted protein [Naegleria gruberi strain NEG-M]